MVTVGNADPELSNQGDRELGRSFVYKQGGRDPNFFGMSDDNISKPSRLDDSRGSRGNGRDKDYSSPLGSKKESKASMISKWGPPLKNQEVCSAKWRQTHPREFQL